MCGIFCCISNGAPLGSTPEVENLLRQRGPDHYGRVDEEVVTQSTSGDQDGRKVYVTLAASVLALRREDDRKPVPQPLALSDDRGFLLWNGEAWKYDNELITGSDTRFIADRLAEVSDDSLTFHTEILAVLSRTRGPFAFIYYNRARNVIYYGRDWVGRRSLVRTSTNDGRFVLASVPDLGLARVWGEVDADGIYTLDLNAMYKGSSVDVAMTRTPYATSRTNGEICIQVPWSPLNITIPSSPSPHARLHTNSPAVSSLLTQLTHSMELRLPERHRSDHPPIAILFSGGLDCTLLARLAHAVLHKNARIDLLNVAFENPRIHSTLPQGAYSAYETCPDRITARQSLSELQRICPDRNWNLVCIDIPYSESSVHKPLVLDLIHPHNTEMDLSIAMALYFAARGPTDAKVLFSGLGADELFGGYQRHGIAFKRGGYHGLLEELLLDTERLGKRNLGRDDRATARWAREVRYPFLDEDVIAWAMDAPVWSKVGFGFQQNRGEGEGQSVELDDKLVLRCVAKKLGMSGVAEEKKRAIQFGSRSAKMEKGRVKGTEMVS